MGVGGVGVGVGLGTGAADGLALGAGAGATPTPPCGARRPTSWAPTTTMASTAAAPAASLKKVVMSENLRGTRMA